MTTKRENAKFKWQLSTIYNDMQSTLSYRLNKISIATFSIMFLSTEITTFFKIPPSSEVLSAGLITAEKAFLSLQYPTTCPSRLQLKQTGRLPVVLQISLCVLCQ